MTRHRSASPATVRRAFSEAAAALWGQKGRSAVGMIGLGVAVALVIAVQSLVSTVRFQVADSFDAYAATTVHAQFQSDDPSATGFTADEITSVRGTTGVTAASRYIDLSAAGVPVATSDAPGAVLGRQVPLYAADADLLGTSSAHVVGRSLDEVSDDAPVAVIGQSLADEMGLTSEELGSRTLRVGSRTVTVIGVATDSPRLGPLQRGLVIPITSPAARDTERIPDTLLVATDAGAANAVADALPVAVDPYHPDVTKVSQVGQQSDLRSDVDALIVQLGLGASALAALIGAIIVAANATGSVSARTGEIGLRRSLGARRRDVVWQFLAESILLGGAAGLLGLVAGVAIVLGTSLAQQWVPVIDPHTAAVAPIAAVIVSALAGMVPAFRASRIDPAQALRR